jgi:hypothetical protein
MGLLDDAIREHLDLQRRRGADPDAVARAEQEALGPVRREPEPAHAADDERHDEPAAAPPEPVAAAPEHDEHDSHDDEPAPLPPVEDDPRLSDIVYQPTTEFRVEDHHDEEHEDHAHEAHEAPAPADEDVLEETPDFLQETPEHDRLWFEQRPPRDFDFDG